MPAKLQGFLGKADPAQTKTLLQLLIKRITVNVNLNLGQVTF